MSRRTWRSCAASPVPDGITGAASDRLAPDVQFDFTSTYPDQRILRGAAAIREFRETGPWHAPDSLQARALLRRGRRACARVSSCIGDRHGERYPSRDRCRPRIHDSRWPGRVLQGLSGPRRSPRSCRAGRVVPGAIRPRTSHATGAVLSCAYAAGPYPTTRQAGRGASMDTYPVNFAVDYPERELNRLTTFFRIFTVIPIAIVIARSPATRRPTATSATRRSRSRPPASGCSSCRSLLMILFRQKYPRWWFDWNLQLQRFGNRIGVYAAADGRPLPVDRRRAGGPPRLSRTRTSRPTSAAACRWSSGCSRSRTTSSSSSSTSARSSRSSSPGSRSSSPAATRAASSTSSRASCAGTTASSATRSLLVTDQYPPFRLSP